MADQAINVLLIEDNPGDARLIQEMIFEIKEPSFNLKCVDRLSKGKESLAQELFDLVLLDLGLPDSNGLDSFLLLSAEAPDIPIVVLTGITDDLVAKKAVGKGAQDFLVKGQVDSNLLSRSILYAIERAKITRALRHERKALRESERKYRKAFNYTEFYKDLLSHDMANILQSILLSTEIGFLYHDDSKKLQEQFQIMQRQIDRAAKLISMVQKLSTLEESPPQIQKMEISTILKKSIEEIQKRHMQREIQIKENFPEQQYFVLANSLISEVFDNILDNAIKFNNNSTVEISIKISNVQKEQGNYLQLEFIDNGIGIPDDLKEKLFQRAYMEENQEQGTGLGLSFVSKVINSFKGNVWVEDRVSGDYSQGCNFIIQIPETD